MALGGGATCTTADDGSGATGGTAGVAGRAADGGGTRFAGVVHAIPPRHSKSGAPTDWANRADRPGKDARCVARSVMKAHDARCEPRRHRGPDRGAHALSRRGARSGAGKVLLGPVGGI